MDTEDQVFDCELTEDKIEGNRFCSRRLALSFSALLAPGETRKLTRTTPHHFSGERLIIFRPNETKLERFLAYAFWLPWWPLRAIRSVAIGYEMPDWRAPRKGPPVIINNIHVGEIAQMPDGQRMPAELFCDTSFSPRLLMNVAKQGTELGLTVTSTSHEPYDFRAAIFGGVFEQRPDSPNLGHIE